MTFDDFKNCKIFINGQPLIRSDTFPDNRSKNQKHKDREEYFKNKKKSRGTISFEIQKESWWDKVVIKEK